MADSDSTPYGVIYRVINNVTGKVYIGQTTVPIGERWQAHCKRDSYCVALSRSIQKYGKEAFDISIIDDAGTKEELDEKEIIHISLCDSTNRSKGYNLRGGGSFGKHAEASKERMSIAVRMAYENPEFKQKLRAAKTGVKRSKAYCDKRSAQMLGRRLSEEAKLAISCSVRSLWQSDEYKAKVADGQRSARSDERYIASVAASTRAQWSDPTKREALKTAQAAGKLAMWADPERKAAFLAKRNATNAAKKAAQT